MKPEIQQELIQRLRSGKYIQTKGVLKEDKDNQICHCVGGILVEMYLEVHHEENSWEPESLRRKYTNYYRVFNNAFIIPDQVCEWAEVSKDEHQALTNANDEHLNFTQLADVLKANTILDYLPKEICKLQLKLL